MGEIAQQAGVTRETVRQVLLALQAGGTRFKDCSRSGWQLLEEEMLADASPNYDLAGLSREALAGQPSESPPEPGYSPAPCGSLSTL